MKTIVLEMKKRYDVFGYCCKSKFNFGDKGEVSRGRFKK